MVTVEEETQRQAVDALAQVVATAVSEEVQHEFLEWTAGTGRSPPVVEDADATGGGTPIGVETCEEDIITI